MCPYTVRVSPALDQQQPHPDDDPVATSGIVSAGTLAGGAPAASLYAEIVALYHAFSPIALWLSTRTSSKPAVRSRAR